MIVSIIIVPHDHSALQSIDFMRRNLKRVEGRVMGIWGDGVNVLRKARIPVLVKAKFSHYFTLVEYWLFWIS